MVLVQYSELSTQPLSPHSLPGLIPHSLRLALMLKPGTDGDEGHADVSTIQTPAKLGLAASSSSGSEEEEAGRGASSANASPAAARTRPFAIASSARTEAVRYSLYSCRHSTVDRRSKSGPPQPVGV